MSAASLVAAERDLRHDLASKICRLTGESEAKPWVIAMGLSR